MPSARGSAATSKLLSFSLAGELKRLKRQSLLKGGGRSSLAQERTRVDNEQQAWTLTSVTPGGSDFADQEESRTSAVLASNQPQVSMPSSAPNAKKRKRVKRRKKRVTPCRNTAEEGGGLMFGMNDQKKEHVGYSQSSEDEGKEDKVPHTTNTVSVSHFPPPSTIPHTRENRDMAERCKHSMKKRGRRWSSRLLSARRRISMACFSCNRSTRNSFHPVLFHSRTDLLLRPLQLRAARDEVAFLTCLRRELARKPLIG